jgi:hypothetical protein
MTKRQAFEIAGDVVLLVALQTVHLISMVAASNQEGIYIVVKMKR